MEEMVGEDTDHGGGASVMEIKPITEAERKKLISKYVKEKSIPNNDHKIKDYNASLTGTEISNKLRFRFINFNDNNGATDLDAGDLTSFFTALSNGNSSVSATAENHVRRWNEA